MTEALTWLDAQSYVARYAWFGESQDYIPKLVIVV